jgi:hypothetical protein
MQCKTLLPVRLVCAASEVLTVNASSLRKTVYATMLNSLRCRGSTQCSWLAVECGSTCQHAWCVAASMVLAVNAPSLDGSMYGTVVDSNKDTEDQSSACSHATNSTSASPVYDVDPALCSQVSVVNLQLSHQQLNSRPHLSIR